MNAITKIIEKLLSRGQTLGLAESCTGGLIASMLSREAGVSRVFLGGVVAYSNDVKAALLKVPVVILEKHGAVSSQTALAMAEGAMAQLQTDWAISVTGIAGPGGGSVDKPVGTVHFAVVGTKLDGSTIKVTEAKLFSGTRIQIQQLSADFALDLLLENLAI